jgi:Tfp pilus assembly protein PilO
MDANRIWSIGAVVAMIAILVGGWFLGIQPQLDAAASAQAQRAGIQQLNAANEAALRALQADDAKKNELSDQFVQLSASVPALPQFPIFLDEVNEIATSNHVVVSNATTSSNLAYQPVAPATPQPAAGSSGASPAPTSSPTPSPSATAAPSVTAAAPVATNPLITSKNFYAVPVSFTLTGDTSSILNVVEGVQKGKRLFLINGLTTSVAPPGSTVPGVQAQVSGFIYVVRPDRSVQGAG